MKLKNIVYCLILLVPCVLESAIWLRKDPQAVIAGEHNFFFPFLKEANIAIVRNYPDWAQEVLTYFAQKIKEYPTSVYSQDKDPKLVTQAQIILQQEYGQLGDKLINPKSVERNAVRKAQDYAQCIGLSSEQRKNLHTFLTQTYTQLFGKPIPKRVGMVGVQGPKLEDFQRRAAIENIYAAQRQGLDQYASCSTLARKDKNLIQKAYEHLNKLYNETLDSESLRTKKMMENV